MASYRSSLFTCSIRFVFHSSICGHIVRTRRRSSENPTLIFKLELRSVEFASFSTSQQTSGHKTSETRNRNIFNFPKFIISNVFAASAGGNSAIFANLRARAWSIWPTAHVVERPHFAAMKYINYTKIPQTNTHTHNKRRRVMRVCSGCLMCLGCNT